MHLFSRTRRKLNNQERVKLRFTYQRCRSSYNSPLVIVLGSMTRADELVLSCVKWHNTPKVRAHSINSICCKSSVFLHNKVGGISLKILSKISFHFFYNCKWVLIKLKCAKSALGCMSYLIKIPDNNLIFVLSYLMSVNGTVKDIRPKPIVFGLGSLY